jgi:predicted transcriptional regulator
MMEMDKIKKGDYLTIRLPDAVKRQLAQRAEKADRTLAGQVLYYIKQGMANEDRTRANPDTV